VKLLLNNKVCGNNSDFSKSIVMLPTGEYMFIKIGDAKIVSVLDEEEMTDVEKETLSDLTTSAKKAVKQLEKKTDTSKVVKKSGS
jgi:DNA-binding protein YbaB